MQLVEYKRHLVDGGIVDPKWIVVGGYMRDPDTNTYIGTVLDEAEREYYIPDTLVVMTAEQAVERYVDIHNRYPIMKTLYDVDPSGLTVAPLTTEEVEQKARDIVASIGV